MRKILELGPEHFMSGIAPGSQIQNAGLWHRAEGITVFRNPFLESDELGILQASPAPTELTGEVIQDTPIAWTVDPVDPDTGFGKAYFWGNDGWLYSISLVGDASPVNVNASVTPPVEGQFGGANGLFVMEHSTGVKRVYYFRTADIGYYGDLNGTPTFNTAVYTDDIEDTIHHPTHQLFDRHYFGNGRYVGLIEDDGSGGLTITPHALDLPEGMTVTTVTDDSHYLVVGATTNPPVLGGGAGSLPHGTTKIFFWDTNSSSWEREWTINDSAVYAIRRVGSLMLALTGRGLYGFTIDSPPQMLLPFMNSGDAPSPQFPSHFMADVLGEALVWGNSAGSVSSWGKFGPSMKNAYFKPFSGFGAFDISLVCVNAKTNDLIVGTGDDKLFRTKWSGEGTNLEGVSAETIFIDLKRWWQVGRVVVEFANTLQEGDFSGINLIPRSDADSTDAGSADFAVHGAIQLRETYCSLEARTLKVGIDFNTGAVRIRNISVWGDPLERPTHT